MSVLPKVPKKELIVSATSKWEALAKAAEHFYDSDITAEQFEEADTIDRNNNEVWWEDHIHDTYCNRYDDGDEVEYSSVGGWLMAEPLNLENVWRIYSL